MRTAIGNTIIGLAAIFALFAFGTIAYDIYAPVQTNGSNIAKVGAITGSVLGIIIRAVVLIALATTLLFLGLRIKYPNKYSFDVIFSQQLSAIAVEHSFLGLKEQPQMANDFLGRTDAELIDTYHHIDRQKYPERFDALAWVICLRTESSNQSNTGKTA